jgi:hypothetical protein
MRRQRVAVAVAVSFFLVCVVGFCSLSSRAQDIPRISVSLGPSYVRFDSKTLGFADKTNLAGGTGEAAFNITRSFGVTGQIYADYGDHVHLKGWMAGPQFYFPKWHGVLFGHLLFGKTQTRVETVVGNREFQSARSYALGGGYEFPLTAHFAIRPIEVDYLNTSSFGGQSNLRVSAALVYRWGALKKHIGP